MAYNKTGGKHSEADVQSRNEKEEATQRVI